MTHQVITGNDGLIKIGVIIDYVKWILQINEDIDTDSRGPNMVHLLGKQLQYQHPKEFLVMGKKLCYNDVQRLIFIQGKIYRKSLNFLIDTGSEISLIKSQVNNLFKNTKNNFSEC